MNDYRRAHLSRVRLITGHGMLKAPASSGPPSSLCRCGTAVRADLGLPRPFTWPLSRDSCRAPDARHDVRPSTRPAKCLPAREVVPLASAKLPSHPFSGMAAAASITRMLQETKQDDHLGEAGVARDIQLVNWAPHQKGTKRASSTLCKYGDNATSPHRGNSRKTVPAADYR